MEWWVAGGAVRMDESGAVRRRQIQIGGLRTPRHRETYSSTRRSTAASSEAGKVRKQARGRRASMRSCSMSRLDPCGGLASSALELVKAIGEEGER